MVSLRQDRLQCNTLQKLQSEHRVLEGSAWLRVMAESL